MQQSELDKLSSFIHELAACPVPSNACNQYSNAHDPAGIRRNNLCLYLHQMEDKNPKILLVGEAAGYLGCRLTGIPFTSEEILLKGIPEFRLFGESQGYRIDSGNTPPCKESTATMMWEVLVEYEQPPLLWNAYPFHPFRTGNPNSNRTPTNAELNIGKPFLLAVKDIYNIPTIVAVGKKADSSLTRIGLEHHCIRHPSHGGKEEFARGVMQIMHETR